MSEREILSEPENVERALAFVDAAKRETLRKLILGAAFAVPVVASFSIDGLIISKAQASSNMYSGNMYYSGRYSPFDTNTTNTTNTTTH
jgi:hypothetical protein